MPQSGEPPASWSPLPSCRASPWAKGLVSWPATPASAVDPRVLAGPVSSCRAAGLAGCPGPGPPAALGPGPRTPQDRGRSLLPHQGSALGLRPVPAPDCVALGRRVASLTSVIPPGTDPRLYFCLAGALGTGLPAPGRPCRASSFFPVWGAGLPVGCGSGGRTQGPGLLEQVWGFSAWEWRLPARRVL